MLDNGLTLLGMLAAVAVILALAWWATRWIATRGVGSAFLGNQGAEFCVLRQITVGRAERLLLVRLGERCMLLGVTAASITLLKELNEEEAAYWMTPRETAASAQSFLDVLKDNLKKKK